MLYPILFTPIYKEMIWGGTRMAQKYGRVLPFSHTGESWDISNRPKEMGIAENGAFAGMSFQNILALNPADFLGRRLEKCSVFPLLVKIIDANDDLSVQVHPDDNYAASRENDTGDTTGKNEMWYVMDAPPDGYLIIGLDESATKEKLRENPMECLNRLPVKQGDIINIPAGLVHAITKGVIVAEIQQNANLTYRLYDYGRLGLDGKPRALQTDDALKVADFSGKHAKTAVRGLSYNNENNTARFTYAIANRYFAVIKYEINGTFTEYSDGNAFSIFTCVEGECVITGGERTKLVCSRSVFIPAGLRSYEISSLGRCVLLKSFVPDIEKDFIAPLRVRGFAAEDINLLINRD